jgi:hypothetical protein
VTSARRLDSAGRHQVTTNHGQYTADLLIDNTGSGNFLGRLLGYVTDNPLVAPLQGGVVSGDFDPKACSMFFGETVGWQSWMSPIDANSADLVYASPMTLSDLQKAKSEIGQRVEALRQFAQSCLGTSMQFTGSTFNDFSRIQPVRTARQGFTTIGNGSGIVNPYQIDSLRPNMRVATMLAKQIVQNGIGKETLQSVEKYGFSDFMFDRCKMLALTRFRMEQRTNVSQRRSFKFFNGLLRELNFENSAEIVLGSQRPTAIEYVRILASVIPRLKRDRIETLADVLMKAWYMTKEPRFA